MNGKKSKILRRKAEALTVGDVAVEYSNYNLFSYEPRLLQIGCTRQVYQSLKSDYKELSNDN